MLQTTQPPCQLHFYLIYYTSLVVFITSHILNLKSASCYLELTYLLSLHLSFTSLPTTITKSSLPQKITFSSLILLLDHWNLA